MIAGNEGFFNNTFRVGQASSGIHITGSGPVPNIKSGDFDIGGQGLQGDGDEMMRVSRIFPDFSSQTGQAKIQLDLKDFPNDTSASSSLGPFTVDANTKKIDSRARA